MKVDKLTRLMIMSEVKTAIREAMESSAETWVSGEELGKQFQMFSPAWLKRYGETLPRTQAVVEDASGRHRTGWYYPRNRIGRMIEEGEIRTLKVGGDGVADECLMRNA